LPRPGSRATLPAVTTPNETALALLDCYQKALGHELPNLLVAGQGLARLLLLEAGPDPETRGLLERLAQSLRNTDGLVRRLASLGRLLRQPLEPRPIDVADLVHEVAAEVRSLPGMPTVEPTLVGLPTVRSDFDRLRRILLEVLRNAYQAARADAPLRVAVEWHPGKDELILIDNGRGLPDVPVEALLGPFPPGTAGRGLGLFTAGLLARGLGGELTPRRLADGTLVRLYLPPLADGEPAPWPSR